MGREWGGRRGGGVPGRWCGDVVGVRWRGGGLCGWWLVAGGFSSGEREGHGGGGRQVEVRGPGKTGRGEGVCEDWSGGQGWMGEG